VLGQARWRSVRERKNFEREVPASQPIPTRAPKQKGGGFLCNDPWDTRQRHDLDPCSPHVYGLSWVTHTLTHGTLHMDVLSTRLHPASLRTPSLPHPLNPPLQYPTETTREKADNG